MRKDTTRKQILDTFSEKLRTNFEEYCQIQGIEGNRDHFITYLYDHKLIASSAIKQYTILATFDDLFQEKEGKKTETVELLAHRFNLTPRSIWNVLRKRKG